MTNPGVLLTRSGGWNAPLQKRLVDAGIKTAVCPLQTIDRVELTDKERQKVINLDRYDLIIFVSRNAVRYGLEWIDSYWPQPPRHLRWFAIGPGTGKALKERGLSCSYPANGSSEALLDLEALSSVKDQMVLIVRGTEGRELLKSIFEQRGARVEYLEVYQRLATGPDIHAFETLMINKRVRVVVIASGEVLTEFFALISQLPTALSTEISSELSTEPSPQVLSQQLSSGVESMERFELLEMLEMLEIVVPSDRIGKIAKEMGFKKVHTSQGAELEPMFTTLVSVLADIH